MRIATLFFFITTVFITGCGTSTGNPADPTVQETADYTISSAAFTPSAVILPLALWDAQAYAAVAVTEFKFCVKRLRLKTAEDVAIDKEDDDLEGEIDFAPGLIDVSDGLAKDWGTVTLPTGQSVERLEIVVQKDDECVENGESVEYSVRFNEFESEDGVEFKWRFATPLTLSSLAGVIRLSLDAVVTALKSAAESGGIDDLKEAIEEVEGDVSDDSDEDEDEEEESDE